VSVDVSSLDRKALTEGNMRIFYRKWGNEINRFLTAKLNEGIDVRKRVVEEDPDYWFLARLERLTGREKFWQSVEGLRSGKERI